MQNDTTAEISDQETQQLNSIFEKKQNVTFNTDIIIDCLWITMGMVIAGLALVSSGTVVLAAAIIGVVFGIVDLGIKLRNEIYHHAIAHEDYNRDRSILSRDNLRICFKKLDNIKFLASTIGLVAGGTLLGVFFMPETMLITNVVLGMSVGISLLVGIVLLAKLCAKHMSAEKEYDRAIHEAIKHRGSVATSDDMEHSSHATDSHQSAASSATGPGFRTPTTQGIEDDEQEGEGEGVAPP